MRVLLSGAGGFLGSRLLGPLAEDDDIHLTLLDRPEAELPPGMRRVRCDLSDQETTAAALRDRRYDVLLHLAGLLGVRDYARLQAVNALGTKNLLLGLGDRVDRVIVAGSCAVYGEAMDGQPLDELSYVDPPSPYGRSMAAREALAREMAGLYGTELCILRLFNLAGPGQRPVMLIPRLARDLVRIKLGQAPPRLQTGPLDTRRDYVDVRDAARAFLLAMRHRGALPEKMNIASGRTWSGRQILKAMTDSLSIDPELVEKSGGGGIGVVRGDASLAGGTLGWEAAIPMSATLRDVLREWLRRLRPSAGDR
jgi:GDP-4-dehydro-6-deoxy-D-mannose reductase